MIFEDGAQISRQDLLWKSEQFAGWLVTRVRPGERVAIMLETRIEYMIAVFAIIAVRGIVVAINPTSKQHDTAYILRDSGAVLALVDAATKPVVDSVCCSCPDLQEVVTLGSDEPNGISAYAGAKPYDFSLSPCKRDDVATVFYTSGTTGLSKGCMASHARWLRSADVWLRLAPRTPADRTLCCTQFHYGDPLIQLLISLHAGGPLVVMRRFSVSRFWDVVTRYDISDLLLIASMPILLLKAPLSDLERRHRVRYGVCVGIPPAFHRELVNRFGFPWVDNYGSTEAGLIARVPLEHAERMIGSGSVGVPAPEVDVRILDEEGKEVPSGTPGELVVRSLVMFSGYLNQPEVTASTLRDGWHHSGDLARQDEEGFLYFLGRKKDMIRRSGENVAAAEIEEVLRTHPKILDAAVIPEPDELRGEEIKAFVQLVAGESPDSVPPDAIAAHCAERLAAFKVPRYIAYQVGDFPRTPSLRVRKELLRATSHSASCWDRERGSFLAIATDTLGARHNDR